jgi:hypothetical protein
MPSAAVRLPTPLIAWVQTYATPLVICIAWAILNQPFLRGRAYVPWDSASDFYPHAHFIAGSIRAGDAPWWNPLIFGGQPLFGDPQSLMFTPQVAVGVLAGSAFNERIFDLTSVFVELCGALALARYARAYADTRVLPILGALVFMAGGVATSRLQHVSQIVSYSLLPMQLLAIRGVCHRPSAARTLILALLLCAGLANPNQVTFLSAFALAPFACLHLIQSTRWPRSAAALLTACLCALIICAPLLSAIQEFGAISTRPSLDLEQSRAASMPLFNIASIFLPGLYGASWPAGGLWPPTDSTQDYLYIGIVPAALIVAVMLGAVRASLLTWLCLGSAAFWFTFAMGLNSPLYPWLFHHLPGLSAFRRPADGAYLLDLFLAILVGTLCVRGTWQRVPRAVQAGAAMLLCAGSAILLVRLGHYAGARGHEGGFWLTLFNAVWRVALLGLGVVFLRTRRSRLAWLAAPFVVAFTIADLGLAGRAGALFIQPVRSSDLARAFGSNRLDSVPPMPLGSTLTFLSQHGAGGTNPQFRMEVLGGQLAGDQPLAFGLMSTQGNNPIRLRTYNDIIGAQNLQNEPKVFTSSAPGYDSAYYRRLGLRYVVLHKRIVADPAGFGAAGAAIARLRQGLQASAWAKRLDVPGDYEIWQLDNAMARAVVRLPDGTQAPCRLHSFRPSEVAVTCHAASAGRLVLGDTFAPGWRACVNGGLSEVSAFDGLFRSVAVPAGESRTVFRYYPVPFLRFLATCG